MLGKKKGYWDIVVVESMYTGRMSLRHFRFSKETLRSVPHYDPS